MNQLINITQNENNDQVLSGRELHEFLEVKDKYPQWILRMTEYGFVEGEDFITILGKSSGGRPSQDHALKLDMAKEISMIQRTPKGKEARQYFIQVEKEYKQQQQAPLTLDQQIAAIATGYGSVKEELVEVKDRVSDLEENAPLSAGEYNYIGSRINQRVAQVARGYGKITREQRGKLFKDINQGVKVVTGVSTRTQLRAKHFDTVVDFTNNWEPSTATKMQLRQMSFDFEE
ncbi:Phage antirepressor protein [Lactococcus lactis subsp. lactis]|uniref:Phage anti-repressor protein n=2 Tax=Lactococcus lactis TaxID=1358 RepID=A0A2A5S850_LACLH|nr:antA/AntB antirepressor family protein [Lactococcus lactis]KAA8701430.1 phage antirepressor Ant [Lactococcus lactis subsp. hordniae]KSU14937.1 Phage antirepressor protein [Lactococcus lactis subsp. lactis]MCT3135540.1 phage antirepressor Ant [Lactococcus lactis]PCS09600.1 Phage anti-repressor protein [Lactococcus lactis subsp. hordniae]